MKVPHLLRYLSWNLVGSHRMLIRLLPEPKVKSSKGEREGDTKPHAHQDEHGREGNSSRGVHSPDEEVEEESGTKYNSREKRGCLEIEKNVKNCSIMIRRRIVYQSGSLFPIIALQCSEHSRSMIA